MSGVMPGVKGTTHLPTQSWQDFWNSGKQWLTDNQQASYELKGSTSNGQTVIFILVNKFGVWVFDEPDYSACVSNTSVFNWTMKSTYETNSWPILTKSSNMAFQSRMVGANYNDPTQSGDEAQSCRPPFTIQYVQLPGVEPPHFIEVELDDESEDEEVEEAEQEEQDVAQSIVGGLMAGLGSAFTAQQEQSFYKQNQSRQFAQQRTMQQNALRNARDIVGMQGQNMLGVSIQQGKNGVAMANARTAGSNPMRNVSANAGTPLRTAPPPPSGGASA
jgi:hypothetical protein